MSDIGTRHAMLCMPADDLQLIRGFPMSKPLSRSDKLIAEMEFAALSALANSPTKQLRKRDLVAAIEREVALDDWACEVYESGHTRWRSIFAFASVGMVKAGYVSKARGVWTISDEGCQVVVGAFDPAQFLAEVNRRYKAWEAAQIALPADGGAVVIGAAVDAEEEVVFEAPEELIVRTVRRTYESLAAELIEAVKACEPEFFEKLVVQLLLKMGYGGSRQEAGQAVGRSGDGGIDGFINEDRLGLSTIYVQAKRWEGSVGEPEIRDFKGALDAKGASKGVFLTTSYFTPAAKEAARNSRSYKIVLVDGARLAELMIEHDLGVSVAATYQLKRLDSDFFEDV
jgi:restriction system protein